VNPATVDSLSPFSRRTYDNLPTEEAKRVFLERHPVYGDPLDSHTNIGLSWTALIQQHYGFTLDHPLPAELVALMMSAMKIQRSSRVFHEDNYTDLSVYADFARQFQSFKTLPATETL
jgi:hypothetical protein